MYPVPPTYTQITRPMYTFSRYNPQAHSTTTSGQIAFRSSAHTMGGSTGSQSHSSNDSMQSYHTTPPKVLTPSPRIPEPTIPPTPYVNQAAVEQHMRAQSPPVPPRNTATVAAPPQESPEPVLHKSLSSRSHTTAGTSSDGRNRRLDLHVNQRNQRGKDGQGVKQSEITKQQTAHSMLEMAVSQVTKKGLSQATILWKCRKEGHVPALFL